MSNSHKGSAGAGGGRGHRAVTRLWVISLLAILAGGTMFTAVAQAAAPPNPATVGATTLSNIELNGTPGTELAVNPGEDVKISADWEDNNTGCSECLDFVATAFAGNPAAGCIENEGMEAAENGFQRTGSEEVDLGSAPSTPGTYEVVGHFEEVFSCGETWEAAASSGYQVIAIVKVRPPDPETVGATTLSNIELNGMPGTELTVNPGEDVKISADWQDNNTGCPECVDYVATAFAGHGQAGCIENPGQYDGPLNKPTGSGKVDLGTAPISAGTYTVVAQFEEVFNCGETWNTANSSGYQVIALITVPPQTAPTELATELSGEGKSTGTLTVTEGAPVTDKATLTGEHVGSATGKATYKVYSDSGCTKLVTEAGGGEVKGSTVPSSSPEALEPGTYYWQAEYSGDELNEQSESKCGSEVETVKPTCTSLRGFGHISPKGKAGENLTDQLSTTLASPQQFIVSGSTRETPPFASLSNLEQAKCRKTATEATFSGIGKATFKGKGGYVMSFLFRKTGTHVYVTLKITNGPSTVYSVSEALISQGTNEKFT